MEMTNGRPISRSHPPLDGDWWAEGDGDTIIELQFELFFFCPFVRDGCHFFLFPLILVTYVILPG